MKTRVLLADDHTIVREGLRAILEQQPDMEVVGEAKNGREAVEMTKRLTPDIVLLDLYMPEVNGLDAARQIRQQSPSSRVLILSSSSDEEHVEQIIGVGAAGYLIKQTAGQDLLKALKEVRNGNAFFSPSISKRLLEQTREAFQGGDVSRSKTRRLTLRERQVLQLIAEGDANKMIADRLGISIKTVEKHRQCLMRKLNLHEAASLTRYAIRRGIVEPAPGGRSNLEMAEATPAPSTTQP
jgi:DNA-binding NarL/FixJ family response regulator